MLRSFSLLSKYWNTLTKTAMQKRSKVFDADNSFNQKSILYNFNIALHPGQSYEGVSQIKFNIQNLQFNDQQFFLDFQGKNIQSLIVNSQDIQKGYNRQEGKIFINKDKLKIGQNNILVKYINQYDNDGSGCVSFTDVDGKQYLYTQFQPYVANRVFPIFDQPNLKAKMNLSIHCPKDWQAVISNQHQTQYIPLSKNIVCQKAKQILQKYQNSIPRQYKSTSFCQTKLLPSYLYCFVVGPYKKYMCRNTYKNIPMNLYCIESLYPYMQKLIPFIQETTNESMKFFESYFGYPYPFSKYDQVFAHQYKWGAMQNAGIVTLNDLYIFKDKVSTQRMLGFGNTIVHELSHHWFGNLVTMRWWDDLWLNESFAEYISHYCLEKIKGSIKTLPYESAMVSFFNRKGWGYMEDMLTTTHPIRSGVQNTQIAQSIFDGITYSKGAATMKQLMYLMGQQNFSKSLGQYFNKFAFKNAQLDDLLNCMSRYYDQDKIGLKLQEWKKMWLQTSSLNEIQCQVDRKENKLIIKQNPYNNDHPHLRTHVIKIGFVKGSKIINWKQVIVKNQLITSIEFNQNPQLLDSDAILLNYDDLSFVKAIINRQYLQYLFKSQQGKITNIKDILLRSMIWKTYFDMVKDGKIKSIQYIQAICQTLLYQPSDTILQQQLNYSLLTINKYTPKKYRLKLLNKMFNLCYNYLIQNTDNSNRTIIIKDKLVGFASTQDQMNQLLNWFNKKSILKHSLNNTINWKIVIKVLGFSKKQTKITKQIKQQILSKQIQNDKSDTMINKKHQCDTLLLKQQQLQNRFNQYIRKSDKWSMSSYVNSMCGFNHQIHRQDIVNKYQQLYYQTIKNKLQNKENSNFQLNIQMLQLFINYMDPILQDNQEDLKKKINKYKSINVVNNDKLSINLKKKISSLEKRLKSYQLF